MSQQLVICSNSRDEGDDLPGGLSQPNSFTNQLSSTIELPENCQVALSSAKVNMADLIDIGSGAKLFYSYFGAKLPQATAPTITETTATPIPARLTSEAGSTDFGALGVVGLAERIAAAMNRRIFYPLLKDRGICSPKYSALGSFEGYDYQYQTDDLIQADKIPVDSMAIDNSLITMRNNVGGAKDSNPGVPRWTYTGGEFETTASATQTSKAIYLDDAPLSPNFGELIVDISDVVPDGRGAGNRCSFGAGLSRGNSSRYGGGKDGNLVGPDWWFGTTSAIRNERGPGFAQGTGGRLMPHMLGRCFGDYMVYMDIRPATLVQRGSAGILRVCHMVHDSLAAADGNNTVSRWRDVPYGAPGPTPGFVTQNYDIGSDINANTQKYDRIKFKLEGEKMTITMISTDVAIGEEILVQYDAAAVKVRNLKPVSQDCWNLAPILTIDTSSQGIAGGNPATARHLTITSYISCSSNHPSTTHSVRTNPLEHSWWLWGENGCDGNMDDEIDFEIKSRNLPSRSILDYGVNPAIANSYVYLGMDNNGGDPRTVGIPAHILSQDAEFGVYASPNIDRVEGANVSSLFGFPLRDVNDFFAYTNLDTILKSTSASVPTLLSTKSMFVRLQNLSNQTINASRSNKSAIISHLPRFDNSGRSSGALFLEPHNLVYVDLNNSNPIKLNSFDLSLVYSNEVLVESLTGTTIICLLFRKNPNK